MSDRRRGVRSISREGADPRSWSAAQRPPGRTSPSSLHSTRFMVCRPYGASGAGRPNLAQYSGGNRCRGARGLESKARACSTVAQNQGCSRGPPTPRSRVVQPLEGRRFPGRNSCHGNSRVLNLQTTRTASSEKPTCTGLIQRFATYRATGIPTPSIQTNTMLSARPSTGRNSSPSSRAPGPAKNANSEKSATTKPSQIAHAISTFGGRRWVGTQVHPSEPGRTCPDDLLEARDSGHDEERLDVPA